MMSEDTPTCQIHQKYDSIKCDHPALPGDPDGFCILHSQDPIKDPAAFRAAIMQIWNKEDSESHDFQAVYFPGRFDPRKAYG